MLIKNAKIFNVGALFAVTFLGVLIAILFTALPGKERPRIRGREFQQARERFVLLHSEGRQEQRTVHGKPFSVTIRTDKPEDSPETRKSALRTSRRSLPRRGRRSTISGATLKIEGDLGQVLASALQDADAMFRTTARQYRNRYGMDDEKKMFRQWHNGLTRINKEFNKEKKIRRIQDGNAVVKKAIEPAYNFYQIDANKVIDHAGMLSGPAHLLRVLHDVVGLRHLLHVRRVRPDHEEGKGEEGSIRRGPLGTAQGDYSLCSARRKYGKVNA